MPPKSASNRQNAGHSTAITDSTSSAPAATTAASATPTTSVPPRATPTPARGGPVQRLQTLKKRTSSGSLVPLNPDGTAPKPTLKYQPKAVLRRSKEEREARERLEAERQRERISEAAATRRAAVRGDGSRGRGRGRGGALGRVTGDVGGPLGWGRGKVKGKYGSGQSSIKRSGVFGSSGKTEGGSGDVSSDEGSDYGARFSIDQINITSDSESEMPDDGKGKASAKVTPAGARGLRPIRVERQEHLERIMDVNTDPSSSKSAELRRQAKQKAEKDSLFVESDEDELEIEVEDIEMVDSAENVPQIKEEPTDVDAKIVDIPAVADGATTNSDDVVPRRPKTVRKKIAIKDTRKKHQTVEEQREHDRYEQDVEELREILGNIPTDAGDDVNIDEDEEQKVKAEAIKDERQGRLFLFQFPPMTPNLMNPLSAAEQAQVEESSITADATGGPTTQPSSETLTIKQENGSTMQVPIAGSASILPVPSKSALAPPLITATSNTLPPGRVGKLKIYKSGRATIDWGGISFELNKGSDVEFLQDAVVASDAKSTTTTTGGDAERKIWAMSQVSGKFVVTPDWDRLLAD